jgi:branched-chain amino acid transport system substrate-binding protein
MHFTKRALGFASLAALVLSLAGCGSGGLMGGLGQNGEPQQPAEPTQQGAAPASGTSFGTGPVKIGLILPLTQNSGPSVVGASLRNAAELAVTEMGGADVTVLVKDDRSSADGARAAAEAAIAEGAELIVGPLFAQGVREAGRVARAANKPVIAFSTDASAAGGGVYLLSFLIESYVDRIVDFAASKGKKSAAVLAPQNDYGNVALAAFQTAAARRDIRVMAIERYAAGGAAAAAQKIAGLAGQIDLLFIPEQAEAMSAVAQALTANGVDGRKAQLVGTGLWNDPRVLKLPALQGAWFAAPENGGFNAFAGRYRAKYGSDPTRIATLGYDAVSLAAALARSQGSQRYAPNVLTNASGFNGADGVFRLRADGLNDRGLAVLQISNGSAGVVSPARRSFSGT